MKKIVILCKNCNKKIEVSGDHEYIKCPECGVTEEYPDFKKK